MIFFKRGLYVYNILRFYFSYIYKKRGELSLIGIETFYEKYINNSLNTYVSYRFESIACQYFSRLAKEGNLDIETIGSYWFDDKENKSNREFDCVLKYSNNEYATYEVEYYQRPMSKHEIDAEAGKMKDIKELKLMKLGLISSSGFEEKPLGDIHYITGVDFYK